MIMITMLPVFKGYTIDVRLKQIRRVYKSGRIDFIEFDSEQGDKILVRYIKSLDPESEAFQRIAVAVE